MLHVADILLTMSRMMLLLLQILSIVALRLCYCH